MLALKGWNTSKSRRTQTMLLPAESLKLTAVSSLSGSRGLRNMAALMLFAIESHSSSQRPCPNQSMKPTQNFVVSCRFMRRSIPKVLGGLSRSLGDKLTRIEIVYGAQYSMKRIELENVDEER
jgi:hypothetical protein